MSYDSQSRLTCVGSSEGSCDVEVFRYDVDGNRISETFAGGQQIFFGDLFQWWTATNSGTSNVLAFGRQIGQQVRPSAALRSAWVPSAGGLPFDPRLLGAPVVALCAVALLALLLTLGAGSALRDHPGVVAAATLLIASLVAPGHAFAGGGVGGAIIKRWITHDHLGNAVLFSEAGGATVKRRIFEPFGEIFAQSADTESTPRLFTGQRYEPRSGLYDFRARWYDAETGRFLSVDPIVQDVGDPQTHNAYSYVRNNPINLVDPNGLAWSWSKILKLVLGVVLIVVGVVAMIAGAETESMELYGLGMSLVGAGNLLTGSTQAQYSTFESGGGYAPPAIQPPLLGASSLASTASRFGSQSRPEDAESQSLDQQVYTGAPDLPVEPLMAPWEIIGLGRALYSGIRLGITALGSKAAAKAGTKAADDRVTKEVIERKTPGADKATSRHTIERNPDGTTRSVTHQVTKDGQTLHQHQRHIGKHGSEREFPDEWIEYPRIE